MAVDHKVAAADQFFTRLTPLQQDRMTWVDRPLGEVCGSQTSFQVQRAWISLSVDAIPVVKAIRDVRGLLNLGDEQSPAHGVDGPRFDQKAIARTRSDKMKAFAEFSTQRGLPQLFFRDPWEESGVHHAVRTGINDDPALCFSKPRSSVRQLSGFVRMDLNGESLLSVDEFHKQGKLGAFRVLAEEFPPEGLHQLAD